MFSWFARNTLLHSTHLNIGQPVLDGEVVLLSEANLALVCVMNYIMILSYLTNIQGKSIFLFYVLFRRLSAGLPTALQVFKDRFFLFTEAGASGHDAQMTRNASEIPYGTWALAASGLFFGQPCDAFLASPAKEVWIVQATPPRRSMWHEWSKQQSVNTYVMDWFPSDELRVLG